MNKVLELFLSLWLLTIHNFQLPLKFPIKTIIKKTPYKERWFTFDVCLSFCVPKVNGIRRREQALKAATLKDGKITFSQPLQLFSSRCFCS